VNGKAAMPFSAPSILVTMLNRKIYRICDKAEFIRFPVQRIGLFNHRPVFFPAAAILLRPKFVN